MRTKRSIIVLLMMLILGGFVALTSGRPTHASDYNSATLGAVVENGKTTIWLRMCGSGAAYQLRSEAPGAWISELFNRTGTNGCSPSPTSWWRIVVGAVPGETFNIYSSNTDTYLSEAQFMARARKDRCTVTAQGAVSCVRQTVTAPGMDINDPADGQTVQGTFTVRGWAADLAATSGPGVNNIAVKLLRNGAEVYSGDAAYNQPRLDVANVYGDARFTNSGYILPINAGGLPNGTYTLRVLMQSSITQQWSWNDRTIVIGTAPPLDTTPPDGTITSPNNQQVVSAAFNIMANAFDNPGGSGVAKVSFHIKFNGGWHFINEDTSAPYAATWTPPANLQTQQLILAIHVRDNAGNERIDPGGYRYLSFVRSAGNENWIAKRYYLNQLALGTNGWQMCSMASVAMIRASAGLIGGDFTSLRNEAFRMWNTGLRGPGIVAVKDYVARNGMTTAIIWDQNKERHWNAIKQEIDAGRPVILNSNSNGGQLTTSGHYIVVVGYRNAANLNDREIIAYDPYGRWTGTINRYVRNSTSTAEPEGVRGRFVYYQFTRLGTIYSLTARRATGRIMGSIGPTTADEDSLSALSLVSESDPTSLPDEVFVEENEEIVDYEGHGQSPWPAQLYLPAIQR